jgi:transposase
VEFKRALAMKACEAGVSVARLALENRINANLLLKWRRQYRAGLFGEPLALPKPVPASFQLLPVVESVSATDAVPARDRSAARGIEVVFACATVRVAADADPGLLRVVLDSLARRR